MTAKRKKSSIANNASIIEKSKYFGGTKRELVKSLGLVHLRQFAVEIKSDTVGNAAKKIKT